MHTRSSWRRQTIAALCVLAGMVSWGVPCQTDAGGLTLKSGLKLQPGQVENLSTISLNSPPQSGDIVSFPFWMLDDGMRRYFVYHRQILEKNQDVELAEFVRFEIPPKKEGGGEAMQHIGPYLSVDPFNDKGHRKVTLLDSNKKPKNYFQGITQLRPQSCTVTGLDHTWKFSIATTSLRREELVPLVRRCINLEKPEDRFKVVKFYLQAGLYELAIEELETIMRDLPDQKAKCEEDVLEARQLYARRLLGELKHRREAGQHRLIANAPGNFRHRISGPIFSAMSANCKRKSLRSRKTSTAPNSCSAICRKG